MFVSSVTVSGIPLIPHGYYMNSIAPMKHQMQALQIRTTYAIYIIQGQRFKTVKFILGKDTFLQIFWISNCPRGI